MRHSTAPLPQPDFTILRRGASEVGKSANLDSSDTQASLRDSFSREVFTQGSRTQISHRSQNDPGGGFTTLYNLLPLHDIAASVQQYSCSNGALAQANIW